MKLDLCSGPAKKEGFTTVDKNPITKPDLLLDITKQPFPFEDSSVEEIWFMHGPEHIERHYWDFIFMEIKRVLIPNGRLVVGYPEWRICAENYIKTFESNDLSKRDYWLQTLYGRRYWEGDEHVTAVNSVELQLILESCGYYRIKYAPESTIDPYNSIMLAVKDPAPSYRERVICEEMGLPGTPVSIQEVIPSIHRV